MDMLTPDLEKEILGIQAKIRRVEFNVRKMQDEKRVKEAHWQFVPVEQPKKQKPDYFALFTLGIGFILGAGITILVRAVL
jgi:hypothetical protein